jgi:ribosomal protein L37AE/L43A
MVKKTIKTEEPKVEASIVNKFRYFCFGCTGRVLYAPSPFQFTIAVCPKCGKVHDGSNYNPQNWLPMTAEEIASQ